MKGRAGRIGALAPGMEAGIVGAPGDPRGGIGLVRRAGFVMRGGGVWRRAA